jgi:hypothetical protein
VKWIAILFLCLPAYGQTWFSSVWHTTTTNSCTVHWTTAVPTIGHLKYGTVAGTYTKYTANSSTFSTHHYATMTGLAASTTYHFRMVSADSNRDWITSLDSLCKTPSTTATTTPTTTLHSVKLNWHASTSSGVVSYEVYRTTISGGYYGLVGSTTALSYTDSTVNPSMTYYYVTKAKNSAGELSNFSNQVQAVVP